MTERFFVKYTVDEGVRFWEIIDDKSKNSTSNEKEIVDLLNKLDEQWIGELNLRETLFLELHRVEEENEQLKLDKQQLHNAMSREEVRHKQFKDNVFDLIDKKIKEADEYFKQSYDSWYQGQIDALKELKKELQ